MTEQSQRKIHIRWKRSGIGFTRRQRASVRGLGLRRLHQVVEREDTPQVRGLVAAVPRLVEIVEAPPTPDPWAAIAEYTIQPKSAVPEEKPRAKRAPKPEPRVEAAAAETEEPQPVAVKDSSPKRRKAPKAVKTAKPSGEKGKGAAAKEPAKKKAKAAEKAKKTKTPKGKK